MLLPKAPVYNVSKIIKTQKKLVELFKLNLHGNRHEGPDYDAFVCGVRELIPRARYKALWDSLKYLAGIELLNKDIDGLAWRLAGNVHNLKKGTAVPPWTRQLFLEWAPVQIMSVRKCLTTVELSPTNKILKQAGELELFVLGGLAAGRTIYKRWTKGYCFHVRKMLGFSQYDRSVNTQTGPKKPNLPLKDITELTKMRFLALIDPELCDNEPNFDKIKCTAGYVKWNRKILLKRQRIGYMCPKGYSLAETPCRRCELGYNQCPAACHPNEFIKKLCPNCGISTALFNPLYPSNHCIDCLGKK